MIRRARLSFAIAIVAAVFAFSGILRAAAPIAQVVFYLTLAFSALSLLFGLFEEAPPAALRKLELGPEPNPAAYQLVLDFGL